MMKHVLLIFTLFVYGISAAQPDSSDITVTTSQLAPGIYRLYVGGGVSVIASIGSDGILLVDDAYANTAGQLTEAIRKLTQQSIKYIINTHWHADHTGGNIAFGKGAEIIAHEAVKSRLGSDQHLLGRVAKAYPAYAVPRRTFKDNMTLIFNGDSIRMKHLAGGHTDGDAIVYIPRGEVLALGDLLFADTFPFVDLAHGGNPFTYVDNLQWVIDNFPDGTTIVGGHGQVYTLADLRRYHTSILNTISLIKECHRKGQTKEEMQKNRILKNWESFGKWFITEDQWIETVSSAL